MIRQVLGGKVRQRVPGGIAAVLGDAVGHEGVVGGVDSRGSRRITDIEVCVGSSRTPPTAARATPRANAGRRRGIGRGKSRLRRSRQVKRGAGRRVRARR